MEPFSRFVAKVHKLENDKKILMQLVSVKKYIEIAIKKEKSVAIVMILRFRSCNNNNNNNRLPSKLSGWLANTGDTRFLKLIEPIRSGCVICFAFDFSFISVRKATHVSCHYFIVLMVGSCINIGRFHLYNFTIK